MKKIIVLIIVSSILAPLSALADPDYKNVAIGVVEFEAVRGIGCLLENSETWRENDTPTPAKIVGINIAAFAVTGCGNIFLESLQHGDSPAEIKSDQNNRLAGAAIACSITIAAQLIYHYLQYEPKN